MPRELIQLLGSNEYSGMRRSQSAFFRRTAAKDFEAKSLHPRIDQLYTWFMIDGSTGQCLRYMCDDCLRKVLLGGKNGRYKRFLSATAIFATRIFQWLEYDEDYGVCHRMKITKHVRSWTELVSSWNANRYPAHRKLSAELQPRLQMLEQRFDAIPLAIHPIRENVHVQGELF